MSADLPDRITVKISSEAAGEITMTPVVTREMPFHDLIEVMLARCGKDVERIRELLMAGTIVESASRFRWAPIDAEPIAIRALLLDFPEDDPAQVFDPQRCVRARICGARAKIDLPRELADTHRMFRRRSFWQALMEVAAAAPKAEYAGYDYRERAHRFRIPLGAPELARLRAAADLLNYSSLVQQVQSADLRTLELSCR